MEKKVRVLFDLPRELKEWLEREMLRISHERGEKISRNRLLEEIIRFYMDQHN